MVAGNRREPRGLRVVGIDDAIDLARLELHEFGRGVGSLTQIDSCERRLPAEIEWVGLEFDRSATIPAPHAIRPRSDRPLSEPVVVEVGNVREDVRRSDREARVVGEEEPDDRRVRAVQAQPDGVGVGRLDRGDLGIRNARTDVRPRIADGANGEEDVVRSTADHRSSGYRAGDDR